MKKYEIYFLLLKILLIVNIVLISLKIRIKFENNIFEIIEKILFKEIPIFEMYSPIFSNYGCDSNYKKISLGEWPGIENGCNCLTINSQHINKNHRNGLFKGKCSETEIEEGCKEINEKKPINYYFYKGRIFCKQKLNYNYYTYLKFSTVGDCPKGFKKCGILDSLNRIMCLKESEKCPINKIIINNNSTSPDDFGYTVIDLDDDFYLHYTNEDVNNYIITGFNLSEGKICANPFFHNLNNFEQYFLEKNFNFSGCNKEYNDNLYDEKSYFELDTITREKLLEDNNLLSYINSLPNYPINNLQSTLTLFSKTYTGFHQNCINDNKLSSEIWTSIIDNTKDSKTYIIIVLVFTIIALLLSIIRIITLQCVCFKKHPLQYKDVPRKCGLYRKYGVFYMKINFIFLAFILSFVCFSFVFSIVSLKFLCDIRSVKVNCGDEIYKDILAEIKNKLNRNLIFVVFIFIINFIEICLIIFEIIFNCKNRNYEAEKKSLEDNFENVNDNNKDNKQNNVQFIKTADFFSKYEKDDYSHKKKFKSSINKNNNYMTEIENLKNDDYNNNSNYNNNYNGNNNYNENNNYNDNNNNNILNMNIRNEKRKISKSNENIINNNLNNLNNNNFNNNNINNSNQNNNNFDNNNNDFNNNMNEISYSTGYVGTDQHKNE